MGPERSANCSMQAAALGQNHDNASTKADTREMGTLDAAPEATAARKTKESQVTQAAAGAQDIAAQQSSNDDACASPVVASTAPTASAEPASFVEPTSATNATALAHEQVSEEARIDE